jgi:hypothetical protein
MNLDLTDEETAALLAELDRIIRERSLPALAPHSHAESDPRQDEAGAGARTFAAATEVIWRRQGNREAETPLGAPSGPSRSRGRR